MTTTTLLPYVRIITYDLLKNVDRTFATLADAESFIARSKPRVYSLYRIERVNGTWRTDWELSA